MNYLSLTQAFFAIAVSGIAAWTDYKSGLIPNKLTLFAFSISLLLGLVGGGTSELLNVLASLFAVSLVPLVLFRMDAMGGGDVKLFAVLGALLGASAGLELTFVAFLLGALYGLFIWLKQGTLMAGLKGMVMIAVPVIGKLAMTNKKISMAKTTQIRLGPAIFVATLIVITSRLTGV